MCYNPRSILDAHVAMEIDLESMHLSQPLIAMGKRENMMCYLKTRYKKRCRIFYRLRRKRCMSNFKGIYKNRCNRTSPRSTCITMDERPKHLQH
jgi:hypothetical protein